MHLGMYVQLLNREKHSKYLKRLTAGLEHSYPLYLGTAVILVVNLFMKSLSLINVLWAFNQVYSFSCKAIHFINFFLNMHMCFTLHLKPLQVIYVGL